MNFWIPNIILIFTECVSALFYTYLTHKILDLKFVSGICLLLNGIGAALITASGMFLPVPDFYCQALNVVWQAVVVAWVWRARIGLPLLVSFFYAMLIDLWFFMITMAVDPGGPPLAARCRTKALVALILLMFFLLLTRCFGCLDRYFPKHTIKEIFLKVFISFNLLGFVLMMLIDFLRLGRASEIAVHIRIVTSALLLVAPIVFQVIYEDRRARELAELKAGQCALIERNYDELVRTYGENARLFHDMRRHFRLLKQMMAERDYTGAAQYLDELLPELPDVQRRRRTGDPAIDYVLSVKERMAAEAQTSLTMQIRYPERGGGIKQSDLCMVLSNLLDNALEATCRVPEPSERFIRLTLCEVDRMMLIKVENSYEMEPVRQGVWFKSAKTNGGLHGWGLSSVKMTVEKYNGTLTVSHADGRFCAATVLSYPDIPVGDSIG